MYIIRYKCIIMQIDRGRLLVYIIESRENRKNFTGKGLL